MILIPLGLVWAGYTLVWYGWAHITGPRSAGGKSNGLLGQAGGSGCVDLKLLDLIKPSQIGYVNQWWAQPPAGKAGCTAPTSSIPSSSQTSINNGSPGLPPGTINSPPFSPNTKVPFGSG